MLNELHAPFASIELNGKNSPKRRSAGRAGKCQPAQEPVGQPCGPKRQQACPAGQRQPDERRKEQR